jgi:hypothetical protein
MHFPLVSGLPGMQIFFSSDGETKTDLRRKAANDPPIHNTHSEVSMIHSVKLPSLEGGIVFSDLLAPSSASCESGAISSGNEKIALVIRLKTETRSLMIWHAWMVRYS